MGRLMSDHPGKKPQNIDAALLYIDLMKRCLTDSIFIDDPLAHFVLYETKAWTSALKRAAIEPLQRFLRRHQVRLVEPHSALRKDELKSITESGTAWPVRAHTMIGLKRLNNIQHCVEAVISDRVPGDLIETGVWRGGACIFMRAILKAYSETERKVWVADSFSGLPPPTPSVYPADAGDTHHTHNQLLSVSRQTVEDNFQKYGLLDSQVQFLEGWFKDTLPGAPIEQLAILRLDGDMYESTIQALDALYDKLSPGGFVIVDDFALQGCAKAIHDFRDAHGVTDEVLDIDWTGVYWRRSV